MPESSSSYISPSELVGLPSWVTAAGYGLDAALDGPIQCGIDIIEVDRIRLAVERWGERFLDRVWTVHEQRVCRGRFPELAARFAGKEAASKALGTGIVGLVWREIEILPDGRGKPLLFLHGGARERADRLGLSMMAISLSHSRTLACAMVIVAS
jgi:holo-[acyl-carrier protein] synthase